MPEEERVDVPNSSGPHSTVSCLDIPKTISSAADNSDNTKVNSSRSSSATSSPSPSTDSCDRTSLSRRQRKNRTRAASSREKRRDRENDIDEITKMVKSPVHHRHHHQRDERNFLQAVPIIVPSYHQTQMAAARTKNRALDMTILPRSLRPILINNLRNCQFLDMSEFEMATMLRRFIRPRTILIEHGYPYLTNYNRVACAITEGHNSTTILNVNAASFVPGIGFGTGDRDSGHGSGSSVENSDLEPESSDSESSSPSPDTNQANRTCARCRHLFSVNIESGAHLREEKCTYHPGKIRKYHGYGQIWKHWDCCQKDKFDQGCSTAPLHVWSGVKFGMNYLRGDFVHTQPPTAQDIQHMNGDYGVYALDCEMCYTVHGLELTRVSVVDMYGKCIYDSFVKPDSEIIDYSTQFSGITPEMLSGVTTTVADVQRDLLNFINSETILIGHGLENDLRALKIIHENVIDSSLMPNDAGGLFRISLKHLCSRLLKIDIQQGEHDSLEDARVTMEVTLMQLFRSEIPHELRSKRRYYYR